MLCTNTIRVIYFCRNCVNLLPENGHFFIFLGGDCSPSPPSLCAHERNQSVKINTKKPMGKCLKSSICPSSSKELSEFLRCYDTASSLGDTN